MFGIISDLIGGLAGNLFAEERQDDQQVFNAGESIAGREFASREAAIARGFNQSEAEKAREFNSAQAIAQRDWAERLSNTQHQRQIKDLEAAGLNPILSARAGAGVPSGMSASGGAATASPANSGIASSGIAGAQALRLSAGLQTASQIEVNEALADRTRAEAEQIRTGTHPESQARTAEIRARIPTHAAAVNKVEQDIAESSVRIERIWEEAAREKASAANLAQQTRNLQEAIPQIRAQVANLRALTDQASAAASEIKQRVRENLPQLERTLGNLERLQREMAQPGHANAERAQDSFIGQLGAYLKALGGIPALIMGGRTTTINRHNNITNTIKVPKQ